MKQERPTPAVLPTGLKEISRELGILATRLRALFRAGQIRGIEIGRSLMFYRDRLAEDLTKFETGKN